MAIRSARGIVIQDGAIALIERHRGGEHYFVFPGGTLELGEESRDALIREIAEETGLIVQPDRIVAEVTFPDRVQSFWLADVMAGEFGSGKGPEMVGGLPPERGTYRAVWLPLTSLLRSRVLPIAVSTEVYRRRDGIWPSSALRYDDDRQWWS